MLASVMELDDEVTLFIGLTRKDLQIMLAIIEQRGGSVLPGLDMLNLARETQCSRVITNLQLMFHEDEEASSAEIVQIGQMLNLDVQHRGTIYPGGLIVDNPENPNES